MSALHTVLYILHMIAMIAIVAGAVIPQPRGRQVLAWAARVQLLVGLGLVAVLEMDGATLNHGKIAVKLLVALGVVALAEISNGRYKRGQDGSALAYAAAGLTIVNAAIAFLW